MKFLPVQLPKPKQKESTHAFIPIQLDLMDMRLDQPLVYGINKEAFLALGIIQCTTTPHTP